MEESPVWEGVGVLQSGHLLEYRQIRTRLAHGARPAANLSQYRSVLLKSPKSSILAQEYRFRGAV